MQTTKPSSLEAKASIPLTLKSASSLIVHALEIPALRAIAMPADANPHGDIFGGWLLSQMDLAGGTVAARRARGRAVTVAITGMTFHRPVFIGDEVTCYADIVEVGRTSMAVKVVRSKLNSAVPSAPTSTRRMFGAVGS